VLELNGRGTLWGLNLQQGHVACPEWIRLHIVNGEKG